MSLSEMVRVSEWPKLNDVQNRRMKTVRRVLFMVWEVNVNELLY